MPRQPVEGKSPKNTEKKEYQFFNTETGEWQTCRWAWFIKKRHGGQKTRFRLPGSKTWTNMPLLFEDKRAENSPEPPPPGPGRKRKYGEATKQVNVPESLLPALYKKMERLEKRAMKNK